jgi:hypothetical protein
MGCKTSREEGSSDPETLLVRRGSTHITLTPCSHKACGETRYALNVPSEFEFHRAGEHGSARWMRRLSAMCTKCRTFRVVFVVWRPCGECRAGSAGPAALSALCGDSPAGTFACLACGAYYRIRETDVAANQPSGA